MLLKSVVYCSIYITLYTREHAKNKKDGKLIYEGSSNINGTSPSVP